MNKFFLSEIKSKRAFSLIEVLVTITILGVIGITTSTIINRAFSGNSKTELIGNIKQNGQAVLSAMEKDIRDSDTAVCPSPSATIYPILALLTKTEGKYIRYTMFGEYNGQNGVIYREELIYSTPLSNPQGLCDLGIVPFNQQGTFTALTDYNSKSAISVKNTGRNGFIVGKNPGFKDTVSIQFTLGPAVGSGSGFSNNVGGTTNTIDFQTTVGIR